MSATPLYTFLRTKGTSFYAFPSAVRDLNYDFTTSKVNFSKFILLNIPRQEIDRTDLETNCQNDGVMNFSDYQYGPRFFNYAPGSQTFPGPVPTTFADQLIESLRNYVANYDEVIHTSQINTTNDFYNVNETQTPTEMIFFKWCRKNNLIDFEPAWDQIDWDKNNHDFANTNAPSSTATDYFRQYLWKERDVINYSVSSILYGNIVSGAFTITINQQAKIKNGDQFIFTGNIDPNYITTGISYIVSNVSINGNLTSFTIVSSGVSTPTYSNVGCYLNYNTLVVYVGEIQSQSIIENSDLNYIEVAANVYAHAGQTPVVLFKLNTNLNYYPNLELPILSDQIQPEIVGAENLTSPIRVNPSNYPGGFYGLFDTDNQTYLCSNGDQLRYSGDYYGIKLSNNVGLSQPGYFEQLTQFNSNNIDGVSIDYDLTHYFQANLPNVNVSNFDDFNSFNFNNIPPSDFNFNAILWYYEMDNGSGDIVWNLYGIEFLNNPNDNENNDDNLYNYIDTYDKRVSNGSQDGTSYIFNLNNYVLNDNNTEPLGYDPTTLSNTNSFDLYTKVLQQNSKMYNQLNVIVSGFTNINTQIFNMQSLIYSQTDIQVLQQQMTNMQNLLSLYSTMQLANSTTNAIQVDYSGTYPMVKINSLNTEYSIITNVNCSDIYNFNVLHSQSMQVIVPPSNQELLIINNNINQSTPNLNILLNQELNLGQSFDIIIQPNLSSISNTLNININFNTNGSIVETNLLSVPLPLDISSYNQLNPTASTYLNSYYINQNLTEYSSQINTNNTQYLSVSTNFSVQPLFNIGDFLYIDNLYLMTGSSIFDYSGAYSISNTGISLYTMSPALPNYNLISTLKMSYYKGMKINILRVNGTTTSSITDRYRITKEYL